MLLLLLLSVLPCVLPLNVVLGTLIFFFMLPVVAGGILSLGLCFFPPHDKATRLHEADLGREGAPVQSSDWFDGRVSRTRPWDRLPQWDKAVVCESVAVARSQSVAAGLGRRTAMRATAMRGMGARQ